MGDEIIRFIEPIYRFCLKRLSYHTDAEDLAQEILLCVLQSMKNTNVNNLDGYVWKIANNRYAKMIHTRKQNVTVLYGDEYLSDIPAENDEHKENEEYQTMFKALHTLSTMYREILVGYYVRNLKVQELSKQYGISVETVKWRLHAGREKIRERMTDMEKTYEKIKMHIMCNGSFGPDQYMGTQLHKAIAKACYKSPLTIEEISLATGIPTLYLEEELDHMIWGDAIEQTGNKYSTNFIILNEKQNNSLRTYLNSSFICEITDTILSYINATEDVIKKIDFYGCDFPSSHLIHILIPELIYAIEEKTRNTSPHLPKHRPMRKDGGNGWFIANEGIDDLDVYFAGCNRYFYDSNGSQSGQFVYYWVGNSYSKELNNLLHNARFYLNCIGPGDACLFNNDEDALRAITNGLCYNNIRQYPSIPIFSQQQYTSFTAWAKRCDLLDTIWTKWIDLLYNHYKSFTPKRLTDQIGGNIDSYSLNLSAYILKELQTRNLADKPDKTKTFTKNLYLIR